MTRAQLTDDEWEFIGPFLPVGMFGPYPERLREQFEGVIWRFRTGSQGREMPERFGAWQTVYNRFMRWRDAGVFQTLLDEAIAEAALREEIDMSLVSVDFTTTRAHHSPKDAPGTGIGGCLSRRKRGKASPLGAGRWASGYSRVVCESGSGRPTTPMSPLPSRKRAQRVTRSRTTGEDSDPLHLGDDLRGTPRARQRRLRGGRRCGQAMARRADHSQRSRHVVLTHPRQRLNHPIECLAHLSACDRSKWASDQHS
ncbi:transposase [Streptomyces sp. NPDC058964]|uniref:transposase n=1 Tax=Streptomyces sp. NPDC058964 TaxID=3346681 RepID=UPI0036922B4F